MDALGSYSDSDDENDKTEKSNLLGGLLANYSDEDDDDSSNTPDRSSPTKKRARTTGGSANEKDILKQSLPPPILSSDSNNASTPFMDLLNFNKDYTKHLPEQTNNKTKSQNDKLNALSKSNESFAMQLQSKKEFNNPCMFPSIIKHFNIDECASNMSKDVWDPHGFEYYEYIDKLSLNEEQARMDSMRMHQQE